MKEKYGAKERGKETIYQWQGIAVRVPWEKALNPSYFAMNGEAIKWKECSRAQAAFLIRSLRLAFTKATREPCK